MEAGAQEMGHMNLGAMVFFLLLWLVPVGLGLVGYIVALIALWRGMRAHERIADRMQQIADALERRRE